MHDFSLSCTPTLSSHLAKVILSHSNPLFCVPLVNTHPFYPNIQISTVSLCDPLPHPCPFMYSNTLFPFNKGHSLTFPSFIPLFFYLFCQLTHLYIKTCILFLIVLRFTTSILSHVLQHSTFPCNKGRFLTLPSFIPLLLHPYFQF